MYAVDVLITEKKRLKLSYSHCRETLLERSPYMPKLSPQHLREIMKQSRKCTAEIDRAIEILKDSAQ